MAKFYTPSEIRPLEKLVMDFSYANGYDPLNVFPGLYHPRLFSGRSPDAQLEIQKTAECRIHGNDR